MRIFRPVRGSQATGDLFNDTAYRLQVRAGMVDHPLSERAPFDELADGIEEVARTLLRTALEHIRAVDAPGDPFLCEKALEIGGILPQVDGRRLDHPRCAALLVTCQIDMAATTGMQAAQNAIAIEGRAGLQHCREGQLGQLPI